jgi:hypothetical protein
MKHTFTQVNCAPFKKGSMLFLAFAALLFSLNTFVRRAETDIISGCFLPQLVTAGAVIVLANDCQLVVYSGYNKFLI